MKEFKLVFNSGYGSEKFDYYNDGTTFLAENEEMVFEKNKNVLKELAKERFSNRLFYAISTANCTPELLCNFDDVFEFYNDVAILYEIYVDYRQNDMGGITASIKVDYEKFEQYFFDDDDDDDDDDDSTI